MTDKVEKKPESDNPGTFVEEKIIKGTGDIQIRKYLKGRLLGKGGFAKCYEFNCYENNKSFAAKVIAKSTLVKSRAKQKLISEIKIHKSLHHIQIVAFEHYFEDTENVYILLELCGNQTLNELLKRRKRLTEIEVQCYVVQLIKALKYLHSHRVIHRDLKLGNLFLTEKMELKVGDFGLATKLDFDGERKRTVCGTPNYIAPEILDGKTGHSFEVDVWSLGVIIYTLIIGKPPFETQDVKTTYKRIKMNAYSFPEAAVISEAAKALITEILNKDPSKRPTLDQLLAHDFFNQGTSIPKLLPTSTLACTPSLSYIRQFMPDFSSPGIGVKSFSATTRDNPGENNPQTNNNNNNNNNGGIITNPPEFNTNTNTHNRKVISEIPSNIDQGNSRPFTTSNGNILQNTKSTSKKNVINSREETNIKSELNGKNIKSGTPDIWVKKWVDYSSKYGMGYLLNNGSTGVFFNDSSKIVLDPKGVHFNYIERRMTDKQEIIALHTLTNYPKELKKKVTLLNHFKSYLTDSSNAIDHPMMMMNNNNNQQIEENNVIEEDNGTFDVSKKMNTLIYVKKWMRTKHAIMFRLSNKIVQVCFQDHTEIILSSESRVVTYVNKKSERTVYPLTSALESNNSEMTKRLKYTKDILTHMLSLNQQQQGSNRIGLNNEAEKDL